MDHCNLFRIKFFRDPPLDLDPGERCKSLEDSLKKILASTPSSSKAVVSDSKFVKRATVPTVKISLAASKNKKMVLSKKGLVGNFTGLWPSRRGIEIWLNKIWRSLIHGEVMQKFFGKGFFLFFLRRRRTMIQCFEIGRISWG